PAVRRRSAPLVLLPGGAPLGSPTRRPAQGTGGRGSCPRQLVVPPAALAGAASGPADAGRPGLAGQGGAGVAVQRGGLVGGNLLAALGQQRRHGGGEVLPVQRTGRGAGGAVGAGGVPPCRCRAQLSRL